MSSCSDLRHYGVPQSLLIGGFEAIIGGSKAQLGGDDVVTTGVRARPAERDDLGLDYAFLRKVVGLIAFALPVGVVLWKGLDSHWGIQGSISSYYYTRGRNCFVGSLCALAVFFLSYDHRALPKYRTDNYLTNVATVAALGVAFFPTTRSSSTATSAEKIVGTLHLVFAGGLFVILGVLSLFFFTKCDGQPTGQKYQRNVVYRFCGSTIFGCIALLVVAEIVSPPASWHTLFWLESVMVWAFAASWLVKGGFFGILADHPRPLRLDPDVKSNTRKSKTFHRGS